MAAWKGQLINHVKQMIYQSMAPNIKKDDDNKIKPYMIQKCCLYILNCMNWYIH